MPMIPRKQETGAAGTTGGSTASAPAAAPAAAAPAAAPAATPAPAPAAAAAPTAAVPAVKAASAVSTAVNGKPRDVIAEQFKDQLELEWNTLHRIQANQGQFLDMEDSKKAFGGEIVLQLLTFQDSWQISPGTDDPADAELVRYSDDGITTNKGEDCKEYLQELIASGRTDAKLTQRVTLAGVIEESPKGVLVGEMVQIDLSTTSKALFDRYRLMSGYKVSKGQLTEDLVGRMRMTTRVQSGKGNRSWTVVDFDTAIPA